MVLFDKPKEYLINRSSLLPDLEPMRVNMFSFDLELREFDGEYSEIPSLDHFSL